MALDWSAEKITEPLYRAKFVNVPDIIADWLSECGGVQGKDVLEFGCGEGTMALGMALRKAPRRVVGVEILDVFEQCLPLAQEQIGLSSLPSNLFLRQIDPGADLAQFGRFDVIYSWSVFEHVAQPVMAQALASIKSVLNPGGYFFLQISPLFFSANGSHLGPWVPEPWAHLSMQHDVFRRSLFEAEETPRSVRSEWAVYIPLDADRLTERGALWETYETLNRVTAPQLCRFIKDAGFEIVRDYRTRTEAPVPTQLAETYNEDILTTEQIVLLLKHA